MDIQENLIRLSEGDLSEDERVELMKVLENDPGLQREKGLYDKVIKAIKITGNKDLRKELDDYLEDHLNAKQGQVISMKRIYYLSGMAAAVLAGVFYLNIYNVSTDDGVLKLNNNIAPIHADSATFNADSLKIQYDTVRNDSIR